MSASHDDRRDREDHRNERWLRLRKLTRHEAEVRRLTDERWQRKVQALSPVSRTVEDPDFPGCVL